MKGPVVRLALCLGAVTSALVGAADARACGGEEIMPAVDYRVMGVAQAEQALRDGREVAAAGSILRMFPEIRGLKHEKDPLLNRAFRVLAMAATRAGGALRVEKEVPREILGTWRGAGAGERQANLEWSITTLRRLNEHRRNDPALQTDLGEALSKVDAHGAEALKVLGDLADKDLISSPEAYAALARLRAQTGDAAGRDAAAARCGTMTRDAAVCRLDRAMAPQS
jgi:hypothetical protein